MKLNTITFKEGIPSTVQTNVPTNTDYAIGIKVQKQDGTFYSLTNSDVKLVAGSTELSATKMKNGYATFIMSSGDAENDRVYDVKVQTQPTTTDYEQIGGLQKKVIGTKEQWLKTSAMSQNFTTDELDGKTFTFETFGNMKIYLSYTGEGYECIKDLGTIHDYCNAMSSQKLIQFSIDGANYWYFISSTTSGYEDIQQGMYRLVGQGTLKTAEKISSFKVNGEITSSYLYYYTTANYPTGDDIPLNTLLTLKMALQIPGISIGTPMKLIVNEDKSSIGDISNPIFDQTITMSGTFTDGTEFSYELPIK